MSWIDIGALDDVPVRGARKLKTQLGCVAVFRTGEDQVYAGELLPAQAGASVRGDRARQNRDFRCITG